MATTPTSIDLTTASDTGASNSDNITNTASPTITGSGVAGETITIISDVDGILGTAVVDGGGNWTFTADGLAEGPHSLTATADDGTNPPSAPSNRTDPHH